MHNLVGFFASVTNGTALGNLTPVTDPLVTVTANNRVIFPMDYRVLAAQVSVPDGTRARLNTPSMRLVALPELYPLGLLADQPANPCMVGPMFDRMTIPRNDEVGIDVSRDGAAAANCFAGLWVTDRFVPAPGGPCTTMRCTATMTLTAGTWVSGNLTFDQVLPFGTYAVIGMHCTCNDGTFARLTFPGNQQYRPGVPCVEALGDYVNPPMFRYGAFGLFGTFNSTAQPGIEILGEAAGAESPVILLDLVKVQ